MLSKVFYLFFFFPPLLFLVWISFFTFGGVSLLISLPALLDKNYYLKTCNCDFGGFPRGPQTKYGQCLFSLCCCIRTCQFKMFLTKEATSIWARRILSTRARFAGRWGAPAGAMNLEIITTKTNNLLWLRLNYSALLGKGPLDEGRRREFPFHSGFSKFYGFGY